MLCCLAGWDFDGLLCVAQPGDGAIWECECVLCQQHPLLLSFVLAAMLAANNPPVYCGTQPFNSQPLQFFLSYCNLLKHSWQWGMSVCADVAAQAVAYRLGFVVQIMHGTV